jgi:hypothetical protein
VVLLVSSVVCSFLQLQGGPNVCCLLKALAAFLWNNIYISKPERRARNKLVKGEWAEVQNQMSKVV